MTNKILCPKCKSIKTKKRGLRITEILKDKKINFGAGMKGNDHDKILIFVSYNKNKGGDTQE